MSLLIVNSLTQGPSRGEFAELAEQVSAIVRRARLVELPIAHLHQGASGAHTALQIPIGRYDLVFRTMDLCCDFPRGLTEFLVHSPTRTIHMVGAIRRQQFRRLTDLLTSAGIDARMVDAALITLDEESLV